MMMRGMRSTLLRRGFAGVSSSGAFRGSAPARVVMADAALKPVPGKPPANVDDSDVWEKVMAQAKSPQMRAALEEYKGHHDQVATKPAGTIDYESMLPRGGMRPFNWADLNEIITSEEGRNQLNDIKVVIDEIQDWLRENDKPVESIDWKYYHSQLDDVCPGFVDLSKEVLDEVLANTPDIDFSPELAQLRKEGENMHKGLALYAEDVEELKKEMEADLEAIKSETAVPDMTTEQVMTLYPELAAEIEAEIEDGKWDA